MAGLTGLFNRILERWDACRETAERSKLAVQAIKSHDQHLLNSVFAKGPIEGHTSLLLGAAIDTDNIEIFDTVLARQAGSDPNALLARGDGGWGVMIISDQPLIYSAILAGKPKIALHLAADPATNIMVSGGTTTSVCGGGHAGMAYPVTTKSPYSTPLDAAQDKGMQDVALILSKRMGVVKAGPMPPSIN